jgi:hypothetical protein
MFETHFQPNQHAIILAPRRILEFEQIVKQIEWFEKEHRSGKHALADLQERFTSIESTLRPSDSSRISPADGGSNRGHEGLEQFDKFLSNSGAMSQALEAGKRNNISGNSSCRSAAGANWRRFKARHTARRI